MEMEGTMAMTRNNNNYNIGRLPRMSSSSSSMSTMMLMLMLMLGLAANLLTLVHHVCGHDVDSPSPSRVAHVVHQQVRQLDLDSDLEAAFKASLIGRQLASGSPLSLSPSPSPSAPPPPVPLQGGGRVYRVTEYGADASGKTDSTEALNRAIAAAFEDSVVSGNVKLNMMEGITNLGGSQIHLQGGIYLISKPLRFPSPGAGNLMIHGGTLRASDDFPEDGYLIDLSASSSSPSSSSSYNYEYITLKDLMLECNYRGGGISVVNSLRTSIDNCYIAHFTTNGILVRGGHETYIRNSFLGQHITAGGDPGERNFTGTAINLMGNDNAVTDVVIFSAEVGIMVSGQANTFSGVHCYNKATGLGGTGIYLKLPGLTQTRIVNCYLDYTGIVAEDPVQLHISSSFFLGDAFVALKSVNGVASGVNIVDNMFSGSNRGIDIVQLEGPPFTRVDQVVVERNNAEGMNVKSTVARGAVGGNGTTWSLDFNPRLLFPNLIKHVQYSLVTAAPAAPPAHALRNVSGNRVVVESDVAVPANVFVTVDQGL